MRGSSSALIADSNECSHRSRRNPEVSSQTSPSSNSGPVLGLVPRLIFYQTFRNSSGQRGCTDSYLTHLLSIGESMGLLSLTLT
jgi:hypothetical protein